MAELATLDTTEDGRCALRFERWLTRPRAEVWQALTELDRLRQWFADVLDYDRSRLVMAQGAELAFVPQQGFAELGTSRGEVTRYEEHALLEYTWGAEILRWELEPSGTSRCRMVFTNVFDDRELASTMGAGWHAGLDRLEEFLAGGDPTASVLEADESAWQRLQEAYVSAWG